MEERLVSLDSIKDDITISSELQKDRITAIATYGDLLYSIHEKGILKAWSLETLRHLRTYKTGTEDLLSITIDDDYLFLGSSYINATLSVWRRDDVSPVISIKDEQGSVLSLVDGGQEVIAARSSGTLDFFSKTDWAKVISLDSEHAIATILSIDHDHIYAGGIDDFVNVIRNPGYTQEAKLEGHEADIFSLCSDGDYLYSGSGEVWWGGPGSPRPPSFESAVRVWKKGSWDCTKVLEGHTDNVNAITADGHRIYSVSDDGTLRVYSKSDWSQIVLPISSRPLTSLISNKDHIFLSNANGRIMKIPKGSLYE